jgi:hypothetical protein
MVYESACRLAIDYHVMVYESACRLAIRLLCAKNWACMHAFSKQSIDLKPPASPRRVLECGLGCFVSPTISYLLLHSKAVMTDLL